jgi:hypothetical protein
MVWEPVHVAPWLAVLPYILCLGIELSLAVVVFRRPHGGLAARWFGVMLACQAAATTGYLLELRGATLAEKVVAYSALFTAHIGLLAMVTEPVVSPDALGAFSGAGGSVSLSYAWSSTDPGEAR